MYSKLKELYIINRNKFMAKNIYPIIRKDDRERLVNKDFTIISDNCWGGQIYQELNIPYNTPFVGLFIFSPDYIKLLENLEYYLNLELRFVKNSKYGNFKYPIGILDDVEIHFLHYFSEEEAKEKWERRAKRINWSNILVKMNDADLCDLSLIKRYDSLDYYKVFFSAKKIDNIKSLVYLEDLEKYGYVKNGKDMKVYRKYFDVVEWINKRKYE